MSEQPVVAYQGEAGAYSEQAVRQQFGETAVPLPCHTFSDIFVAVADGRTRFGMLPIENSLAGTVIPAYDLLIDHDFRVQAEVVLRVEHCLMAPAGTKLADIRRVRSHHQALAQCEKTLKRMGLEPVDYYDTAGAARDLAANPEPHTAAIASALAAETYGLEILARNVEDLDFNFTRFFVLGRGEPARQDPSKTSIIFTT
ncbi:MAG: prephenate dehydratase, partial [Anaerolineae bacterium]